MADPVLTAEWEDIGVWSALGAPRGVSIKRGKDRALDEVTPGSMVLTFGNAARTYDPAHNPAYAALRPGVRMRLRATHGGTTYDLFTGFLERISQQFGDVETPHDATIVYECVDGLSVLAAAKLGSSFETDVRALGPKAWLRMGEASGPWFYDSAGSTHGFGYGNIDYGVDGYVQNDEDKAATFPTDVVSYMETWPDFFPAAMPFTISFILGYNGVTTADQYLFYDTRGFNIGMSCYVDTAGIVNVHYGNAAGTTIASCKGPSYIAGVYQFHIVVAAGQPLRLYSTGVLYSSSSVGVMPGTPAVTNGYTHWGKSGAVAPTFDEIMVWPRALTTGEMDDIYEATVGWYSDTVSDRFYRILGAIGWDPANVVVGNVDEDGQTLWVFDPANALEHFHALATTIEGRIWVRPDGKLQFLSRTDHLSTPYDDSAATFTDTPGGLGYRGIGAYGEDWSLLANVIRRINDRGDVMGVTVTTVSDAASIAAYGLRSESDAAEVVSLFATPAKDYDLAQWRLAHYSEPTPYIDGLELLPKGNAALWPIVLGLDLARRVTFERTPQGVGAAIVHDVIIEGISHTIGPEKWTTVYNVDTSDAQAYFLFDDTLWDSADWRFSA